MDKHACVCVCVCVRIYHVCVNTQKYTAHKMDKQCLSPHTHEPYAAGDQIEFPFHPYESIQVYLESAALCIVRPGNMRCCKTSVEPTQTRGQLKRHIDHAKL